MGLAATRAEKLIMIGLRPEEDAWVRVLVTLLRDADPVVGELTRQAMVYLAEAAGRRAPARTGGPAPPDGT